jgi:phosphoglycolate phosphatase-like HAD superfamily hydrolase
MLEKISVDKSEAATAIGDDAKDITAAKAAGMMPAGACIPPEYRLYSCIISGAQPVILQLSGPQPRDCRTFK